MQPERNGVGCLDMADFGPCQVWDSDLWKCPKCGVEVLAGFGQGPVAEHYDAERFDRFVQDYTARDQLVKSWQ